VSIAPGRSTRAGAICILDGLRAASTGGLLRHLAEPRCELSLVVLLATALGELGIQQRRLDQTIVREHVATMTGSITDVREHGVEEFLGEPA